MLYTTLLILFHIVRSCKLSAVHQRKKKSYATVRHSIFLVLFARPRIDGCAYILYSYFLQTILKFSACYLLLFYNLFVICIIHSLFYCCSFFNSLLTQLSKPPLTIMSCKLVPNSPTFCCNTTSPLESVTVT